MSASSSGTPPPLSLTPASVFMRAFHNSPAMQTVTRAADRTLVEANEAFLTTLGYKREEVIGRSSLVIDFWVQPERAQDFRAALQQHGTVRGFELDVRTKRGEIRTLLLSAEVFEINGDPHVVAAGVDITERQKVLAELKGTHERLRESEAQFSTAFLCSPVIMTIATLHDGRFVEVNESFAQAMGFSRAEVIGKKSVELGIWPSLEDRSNFFDQLMRTRSLRNSECRIRRSDGEVRLFQISAEIVEINRVPHLLTFGIDITQRKIAEEEQQRALEKERELSQLKSDFVSLVSHEFRTPLEVIMSSVDNLDRYHDRLPPEKRQHLLRTINKSVRRMAGMMEEALVLGRLDSGGTEFNPSPMDLAAFCLRVRDEMEAATSRRCPITVTIEGSVAGASGDERVLRHILTNLLSNAVKYSEADQPVQLRVRREGDDAVIRVADQGCGIPEADQQRIFQAFHRGSNVRQIPGTGLGLLIVRRCADLHGGTINFESGESRGATFTVRVPVFAEPGPRTPDKTSPNAASFSEDTESA